MPFELWDVFVCNKLIYLYKAVIVFVATLNLNQVQIVIK